MRKLVAACLVGSMLLIGGVACDDNKQSNQGGEVDDDTRLGPGDGQDEVGPGR